MNALRKSMLFWAYFIGIGAIWGAIMFFIDPTGIMWGMESILPLLKDRLPWMETLFTNFIASGVVLFIVVGLPNIISAILTHRKNSYAISSNMISAIVLIIWILLEFYVWGAALLSVVYLIFGVLQLATAITASIKNRDLIKKTINL